MQTLKRRIPNQLRGHPAPARLPRPAENLVPFRLLAETVRQRQHQRRCGIAVLVRRRSRQPGAPWRKKARKEGSINTVEGVG